MPSTAAKYLWHFGRNGVLLCGGTRGHSREFEVGAMTRALLAGLAALVFAVAVATVVPGTNSALAQSGYDRPGGDYASAPYRAATRRPRHPLRARTPLPRGASPIRRHAAGRQCAGSRTRWCRNAIELLRCRRARRRHDRAADRRHRISIDRWVAITARSSASGSQRARLAQLLARREVHCRALTYRRPGYGTAAAHCYLKETIKPPRRRPCCISGVVR